MVHTPAETRIVATFRSPVSAETAAVLVGRVSGVRTVSVSTGRDSAFIVRFLVIVVVASVAGTALGVAVGFLFIALGATPDTTESLVLQIVTWAVFWHLLIGMIAGYVLLADRSESEWRPGQKSVLEVTYNGDSIAEIESLLRSGGATRIERRRGQGEAAAQAS